MDLAYYYELWRGMMPADRRDAIAWWQDFYVKFYHGLYRGRPLEAVSARAWASTLVATALALVIGVVLGVLVAMVRTAHDQQRPGQPQNPVLGVLNVICKMYVTVIRGTPMMVQLLIMGFVIFASSRNYTMVGVLALGINSGAYVAEIIRGGLMALDAGQMEAGPLPGAGLPGHHALHRHAPGLQGHSPRPGQRVHHPAEGHLPDLGHRRQGAGLLRPGHRQPAPMRPCSLLIGAPCMYLILVMIFTWLQGKLERRLRQSDRR